MQVVRDISDMFATYELDTEIIAASIRHPRHVLLSAKAGSDIATVPYNVLKKMIVHPKTNEGIEKFLNDWESRS